MSELCHFCNGLGFKPKYIPQIARSLDTHIPDKLDFTPCQYCKGKGNRENNNPKVMNWEDFKMRIGGEK